MGSRYEQVITLLTSQLTHCASLEQEKEEL